MRQLLPEPADPVEPYEVYRPPDPQRRMVRANMVVSADGAATDPNGRSGGLAGSGDREVFRTLRALSDVVLVGAGTARKEGYGPARLLDRLADRRRAEGRLQPPPIALVSRSLDLDFASPLFTEAVASTIVVTCAGAPADRRRQAARAARVVLAGEDDVDLAAALRHLQGELNLPQVLCEGGPNLLRQLVEAQLLDELCLTIAPVLFNQGAPTIAGKLSGTARMRLGTVCEQDDELYLRYAL